MLGNSEVIQFDGLSATRQSEMDPCFWWATSASRAFYVQVWAPMRLPDAARLATTNRKQRTVRQRPRPSLGRLNSCEALFSTTESRLTVCLYRAIAHQYNTRAQQRNKGLNQTMKVNLPYADLP